MMTIQEFNEKYNCKNYDLAEVENFDPECDDYRYLMTHTYKDWTHPEAAFNSVEEAEKYIEWIEKKEAEDGTTIIY